MPRTSILDSIKKESAYLIESEPERTLTHFIEFSAAASIKVSGFVGLNELSHVFRL